MGLLATLVPRKKISAKKCDVDLPSLMNLKSCGGQCLCDLCRFATAQCGALFLNGKTVLLGMIGGYVGFGFAKWRLAITEKTGGQFAVLAAVSIGVER